MTLAISSGRATRPSGTARSTRRSDWGLAKSAFIGRQHRTGPDRIDADAVAGVAERQRPRHAGDARLRHHVGDGVVIHRRLRLHRRGGDDGARAAGIEKMLDGGLRAQERAAQVHRHDPVVVGDRRLVRLVDDLDAGIVDEDIEAFERLDDAGEERIDRVLVGDVGRRQHMAALRTDPGEFLDQRLCRLRIADEIDRDAGAFLGKADGGRPPDAGRRPGDQHPLAFKPAHGVRLPSVRTMRVRGQNGKTGGREYGYIGAGFPKVPLPG